MSHRILFLNRDYRGFLSWLYRSQPGLALRSYDGQMAARSASLFGTADFMSRSIGELGHTAVDIHANNRPLQEAWMTQHGVNAASWLLRAVCSFAPRKARRYLIDLDPENPRFGEILAAQIAAFQPTILYNHDPSGIPADLLTAMMPGDCALVGQIASPRDPRTNWRAYDLLISSLPNFVARFREEGLAAEYLPLAFEPRVLARMPDGPRDIPVSFVGSLSPAHRERLDFLESIGADSHLQVWGDGAAALPKSSKLLARHRGPAWGPDMFGILRRSQLTLNKHIDVSERYANNMRLFEATGMGACLVTDWKENLGDLFEPGKEVVAYRSVEECRDLVRHYETHDSDRLRIAAQGHARCLRDHSYAQRMADLNAILTRYFS